MAFDEELTVYAESMTVRPYLCVQHVIMPLSEEAGEVIGPKMDALIRQKFKPEIAEKIVGKYPSDLVFDDPTIGAAADGPHVLDIGFFLFATAIDWDEGTLRADWYGGNRGFARGALFGPDILGTRFEDASFEADLTGLSFEVSKIEMLLPNFELRASMALFAEVAERPNSPGRPRKWGWDDAMAYIISVAQSPDGLPTGQGAQTRIEEMMAEWFIEQTGNSPSTSQIRGRAATIVRMIEKAKTSKIS